MNSELGLPNAGALILEIVRKLPNVIPDPNWLPWLGIAVAGLLVLAILRLLIIIWREADVIAIDPYDKSVSGSARGRQRWLVEAGEAQAVYVSEVVKQRGARRTVYHGEINLQLRDGSFMPLLVEREKIINAQLPGADAPGDEERSAGLRILEPGAADTALQAAAAHIAVCLGELAVWQDRRLR